MCVCVCVCVCVVGWGLGLGVACKVKQMSTVTARLIYLKAEDWAPAEAEEDMMICQKTRDYSPDRSRKGHDELSTDQRLQPQQEQKRTWWIVNRPKTTAPTGAEKDMMNCQQTKDYSPNRSRKGHDDLSTDQRLQPQQEQKRTWWSVNRPKTTAPTGAEKDMVICQQTKDYSPNRSRRRCPDCSSRPDCPWDWQTRRRLHKMGTSVLHTHHPCRYICAADTMAHVQHALWLWFTFLIW